MPPDDPVPDKSMPDEAASRAIRNKQIELLAGALNTTATSSITVGIATPIAGYLYDIGGLRGSLGLLQLLLGGAGWLAAAVCLHLIARRTLKGLRP